MGQDGPTHHGTFDLSYLRCIPNMVIGAPSDENECRAMLQSAWLHEGPSAVRYPRGEGTGVAIDSGLATMDIGKGHLIRQGAGVAILNFGVLLDQALAAAESLDATVVDMRWVKPFDEAMILSLVETHHGLITLKKTPSQAGPAAVSRNFWQRPAFVAPYSTSAFQMPLLPMQAKASAERWRD